MLFTPGPWKVMPGKSAPRICVYGDREWPIVVTISGHSDEAIKANQDLIAAAPDLLAACKRLVDPSFYNSVNNTDIRIAKKAIAKAEGKI